ncbi:kinase-like domain-containing protein [Rhizophagus diaphanus]|nr:kinase-like domain-containing protein [Rhizophagus diaphanus] [Rhizophagus sp. MUCL 43196]
MCGISQKPDTNDYILVQDVFIWTSGNEKIDDFIQEIQFKTNNPDIVFEWIPYNQFNEIKETGKNDLMTAYSAIWKDGPLYVKNEQRDHSRDSNKEVALKCLHNNSQNPFGSLINEVKKHMLKKSRHKIFEIYGISQNPVTNDYILVQNNFINLINWLSGNEKIDDFIQEMQFKIKTESDIIFKWVPYNQFCEIKKIGKGGFATIYSAMWRNSNMKVALKYLDDSQILTNELLNEIKAYSTKAVHYYNGILKVYGISQDPDTSNYIIVLQYAEGGNFSDWLNTNENFSDFIWENRLQTLHHIANGLKEIHENQMAHRDFHTGNILVNTPFIEKCVNRTYISDMGLCGKVGENNQNNIYGVMPYVAPEVLRGKPYTQKADIYSFGMIMYFTATGRQPFDNRAHDHLLALDICDGLRPEINEPEAPKSYIELMKECWDPNPENRPDINKFIESLCNISMSEIKEAEKYRNTHLSSLNSDRQIITHPQAVYTSRLLNSFTENLPKYFNNSECLGCVITINPNYDSHIVDD